MAYLMAHTLLARTLLACTLRTRELLRTPDLLHGFALRPRQRFPAIPGRRLPLVVGCLGLAWVALGCGALVQAQQAGTLSGPAAVGQETLAPTRRDTTSRGSSAAVDVTPYPDIPESPADTGRMRHGWHDFSRYGWAGNPLDMCGLAVQGAFATVWRHDEDDTASYAARKLTPPPVAVRLIAQRCGGGLLLEQLRRVAAGDSAALAQGLFPAYSIALALGPAYDTAATALLRAVVARSRARDQWDLLLGVFRADTATHPLRLSFLERDTALFDSLRLTWARGQEVHDEGELGKLARRVLWQHWMYMRDTARARGALEVALAAERRFHEQLDLWDAGWVSLLRLKMLQSGLRSRAVVRYIEQGVAQASGDSTGKALLPFQLFDATQYEKPFVWPETPYWYSAAGTPLSVSQDSAGQPSGPLPLPEGKVTLVWNPPYGHDHAARELHGAANLHVVLWLRQLIARYGAQGFQVVILEHTRGSAMGEALPIEQEAGAIRHFYQDMLQFPGLVVVEPVAFKMLPDGRRWDEVTDWERRYNPMLKGIKYRNPVQSYGSASPQGPFLLDRHGKLRLMGFSEKDHPWTDFRSGNGDPMFELFIQHLLTES